MQNIEQDMILNIKPTAVNRILLISKTVTRLFTIWVTYS